MINSIFKRDLSLLSAAKDYDYQVRINGPYYSYRDPITGRREFVFDEEVQAYLDEGLTLPKAIERFLARKYSKSNRQQQQLSKTRSVLSSQNSSTVLSPWVVTGSNKASTSNKHQTGEKQTKFRVGNFDKQSPPSTVKQHSFIIEDDDDDDGDELNDEQKPLVTLNSRRRWQLKLDADDSDSAVETRHGAMSVMCMKDDLQKYMTACKQFEVSPSQTFIDQIGARTLRIKYLQLSPIELGPMLHILADRSTPLTSLDLSCNPLTEKSAGLLVAFLNTSAADCLTYLNLSECMLGLRGGQQILDCVQDNFSIKELYLSSNDFSDAIGSCLQNFLAVNDVLKHLDISRNGLSVEAAEKLADGISKNTSLYSINLSWNGIRLRGGEAIGGVFVMSTLSEIDLSWNGISNDGARAISASLAERTCMLKVLNLECNRIGMLGAYALARALRHNRMLKRLDLTMNPITTEGVKALLKALMNNYYSGIEMLEIRDVPIEQGFNDLIDQIRRRKTKRTGSEFNVAYGHAIHDPDFYITTAEAFNRVNDPITILFKYIKEKGLRLMDLFAQFDKDRSSTVSIDEFRNGFIAAKIPLTEAQLDYLFGVMDIDGNGEIDYGELLAVQQQYRENLRRKLRIARQEEILSNNEQQKLPRLQPKEDRRDAKKSREKILKARDAYMHHNSPVVATVGKTAGMGLVKLPDISVISAASHQGSLSSRRQSTFKAALDAERRKLFNSVVNNVNKSESMNNNRHHNQRGGRYSRPPAIEDSPDETINN